MINALFFMFLKGNWNPDRISLIDVMRTNVMILEKLVQVKVYLLILNIQLYLKCVCNRFMKNFYYYYLIVVDMLLLMYRKTFRFH